MKRRQFLKNFTAFGATPFVPAGLTMSTFAPLAKAAPIDYQAAGFTKTPGDIMPQVINIFLYGGPSELAGNLSNIRNINNNSQNSYPDKFGNADFLRNVVDGGQVTENRFWQNAGGLEMEAMLAANEMSIYRTMLKRKSPTRSHRESIFMSHKGTVDIEGTPGVGTRLAAYLLNHENSVNGQASVNEMFLADGVEIGTLSNSAGDTGLQAAILPFVSFEGETNSYSPDPDYALKNSFQGLTLSEDFDNPYARDNIFNLGATGQLNANNTFDALLDKVKLQTNYLNRFGAANSQFALRQEMAEITSNLGLNQNSGLPLNANYPNNSFGDRVKAAVTLALLNPSSFYITVGGGLGGWDDHNNGVDRYADRMQNVMQTMQAAMNHINGFISEGGTTITPTGTNIRTRTDNIVINMFGDFGRLVNLNGSNGWDHANNGNLYTFGGAYIRQGGASALGKVIGTTERQGTTLTNNQYTMPTDNSYTFEPMAVAATTYSYFGASDSGTQLLTESPIMGESGELPIDETIAGVDPNVYDYDANDDDV